jgi:V-type H+-transporting ATPase subunit D
LDREEFYRLKKVSGKKKRDVEAEDKAREEKKAAADDKENRAAEDAETQDLLGDKDNEDVIF